MKYRIVAILLLCMALSSYANKPLKSPLTIHGEVVIKGSNESLPYATVQLIGKSKGAVTDMDGKFTIQELDEGEYRVKAQAVGYEPQELKYTVKSGALSTLKFALTEAVYAMEEVVVSANRNEVSRKEAPVVVNVLSQRLFETVNSTDLAKSLNFQSGLRVENNCQNCGFPQVRINGLEGPYTQLLINSRPIMSALSGVYGLEQIPVNMIERVEVVRGGASALFGANAVGGTINIITKDPVNNSFQVSSTLSSLNNKSWEQYVGANASLVSPENTYGVAFYQAYRNRNPYDADGDGFSELGKLNMNTFGLRAYYRPTQFSKLGVEYHTTNEFRRGGNKFNLQPHESDITEQTKHVINSGGVNYDLFWKEYAHKISLYGSIQHTDRKSYYGAEQDENAYGTTDDLTWVLGSMYVGKFDYLLFAPSTITGGVEYQNNTLHDVMTGYKRDMRQDIRIMSSYLQNEWALDKLSILAGARLDKHNLISNPIISPRINFLYKPVEEIQARLTYSTGFRAPQAYDEDLHVAAVGGEGVQVKLADDLREERSNSFSSSLDWEHRFGCWQSNLLVEGFYTDLRHVFLLEDKEDEQGTVYQERRNGNGARVFGANIDAKLMHGREFQLQVGFTAQRSEYKTDEIWTDAEEEHPQTTKKMPRTPNYYGYFTLTSAPCKKVDFSVSGVYTGKMYVPHMKGYISESTMERSPNFMEFNAKVNYNIALKSKLKVQLNAGVQNIFNAFQKDLDQGVKRDSNYFYGPTQPRTYFVGLKFTN